MTRFSLSALLIALAAATPALAATAIDGWNGYKFGMTVDAARAVPGQVFGLYNPKNLWNENKGAMGAKKDSTLYGQPYALNLFFDSNSKLNGISLENDRKSTLADCGQNFLSVLAQLEKASGPFLPVNPKRVRKDSDTPPTSLEWQKAPGSSSYQLATISYESEYAYVWKARRVVGNNYVDIAATWSAPPKEPSAPCITDITYMGR